MKKTIEAAYDSIFPGSGTSGRVYHELPWDMGLKVNRGGLKERVVMMSSVYDFSGKAGMDLGCAIGGMTFSLQLLGAQMLGVDHDRPAIDLAKRVERFKQTGAKFSHSDITPWFLNDGKRFDFVVWFAQFMWATKRFGRKRARVMMKRVAKAAPALFFETDQFDGKAREFGMTTDEIYDLLYSNYKVVRCLGSCPGRPKRQMFFAQKCDCKISIKGNLAKKSYACKEQFDKEVSAPKKYRPKVFSTSDLVLREAAHVTLFDFCLKADEEAMKKMTQRVAWMLVSLSGTGIAHRDVHAKNVLVEDNGSPLLIDWDLSIESTNSYDFFGSDVPSEVPRAHLYRGHFRGMFWDNDSDFSLKSMLGVGAREALSSIGVYKVC